MLEASAHLHLKALLRSEGEPRWPHHLTLSRLVARSLRRGDHTLVALTPGMESTWWPSLLVPLALSEAPLALVVSDSLRRRLLQVEWPRLRAVGLQLPCWEGAAAPSAARLWLLRPDELVEAWQRGELGDRQLVIPEAERLDEALCAALEVQIQPADWDGLRRAFPSAEEALLALHERLSRRVFSQPRHPHQLVALESQEEVPLRDLLTLLRPLPEPWPRWQAAAGSGWASWAKVDPVLLQWQWTRQPLDPLLELSGLFQERGTILLGEVAVGAMAQAASGGRPWQPQVVVRLDDPPLSDPLPLYAPLRQPLPNSPPFADHLLEHCRRLVLGQAGLTMILLDDRGLRGGLASALAAEFGSRVTEQSTAVESNGVICASWSWWLEHQTRLPLPCQVIVGLLPIASLEDPLTAARVARMRQQGGDWFRDLLLPDALHRLQRGLACLRRSGGRAAVLDGRLRARSWGRQVFRALEPTVPLTRLLPA
ncbi:MAG: helicase [Cyanobacteriota bacterium]|nr:helicase [Cyanobacteriota bacterium]